MAFAKRIIWCATASSRLVRSFAGAIAKRVIWRATASSRLVRSFAGGGTRFAADHAG